LNVSADRTVTDAAFCVRPIRTVGSTDSCCAKWSSKRRRPRRSERITASY
jgi:hypothetical protein